MLKSPLHLQDQFIQIYSHLLEVWSIQVTTQFTHLLVFAVQHPTVNIITSSYSEWTKCHSSGYINYTHFGQKSFKSCPSTSQKLKKFQWCGQKKTCTHLKTYLIQRNYAPYILIHHIRNEHYQSDTAYTCCCLFSNLVLLFFG